MKTDQLPPDLTAHLRDIGLVLIVRKPEPVNRDATGWKPSATDKEPPF